MIEKMQLDHIDDVVEIHMCEFPVSQSTKFGIDFLRSYYKGAAESSNTSSFVYVKDSNVVGFIFGGTNKQKLSRQILMKSKLTFIKSAILNIIKSPVTSISRFTSYLKHYILPGGDKFYADDTASLDSVAIIKEHRGGGIANELMLSFLNDLRSKQISACRLGVLAENTAARKFYERSGFEQANNEGTVYIYYFDEKYRETK
jgi:ribosomal protein S18 acetylase RimI-like enzyme